MARGQERAAYPPVHDAEGHADRRVWRCGRSMNDPQVSTDDVLGPLALRDHEGCEECEAEERYEERDRQTSTRGLGRNTLALLRRFVEFCEQHHGARLAR